MASTASEQRPLRNARNDTSISFSAVETSLDVSSQMRDASDNDETLSMSSSSVSSNETVNGLSPASSSHGNPMRLVASSHRSRHPVFTKNSSHHDGEIRDDSSLTEKSETFFQTTAKKSIGNSRSKHRAPEGRQSDTGILGHLSMLSIADNIWQQQTEDSLLDLSGSTLTDDNSTDTEVSVDKATGKEKRGGGEKQTSKQQATTRVQQLTSKYLDDSLEMSLSNHGSGLEILSFVTEQSSTDAEEDDGVVPFSGRKDEAMSDDEYVPPNTSEEEEDYSSDDESYSSEDNDRNPKAKTATKGSLDNDEYKTTFHTDTDDEGDQDRESTSSTETERGAEPEESGDSFSTSTDAKPEVNEDESRGEEEEEDTDYGHCINLGNAMERAAAPHHLSSKRRNHATEGDGREGPPRCPLLYQLELFDLSNLTVPDLSNLDVSMLARPSSSCSEYEEDVERSGWFEDRNEEGWSDYETYSPDDEHLKPSFSFLEVQSSSDYTDEGTEGIGFLPTSESTLQNTQVSRDIMKYSVDDNTHTEASSRGDFDEKNSNNFNGHDTETGQVSNFSSTDESSTRITYLSSKPHTTWNMLMGMMTI